MVAQEEYKGVIKTFEYHASKAEARSSWGIHNKKASLDTVRAMRARKGYILLLSTGWMTLGDFPNLSELQFPNRKMEIIVLTLWVCCEDYIEWCILKIFFLNPSIGESSQKVPVISVLLSFYDSWFKINPKHHSLAAIFLSRTVVLRLAHLEWTLEEDWCIQ